jgi:drug/metabolite transporter (DMT)-like permease
MDKKGRAYLYIILTVVFWGLSFLSTKVALAAMPPMTIAALRFAIAIVLLYFVKRRLAPGERIEKRDLPYLAGAGLFGVTLYFFSENNGLRFISASESSIIIAVIPVITVLAERIAFKKRLAALNYVGAALSMIGVWIMVGTSLTITANVTGYLFMLGAAGSWVAYCFMTRPLFKKHTRITIVFYQSLIGFLGCVPFAVAEASQWRSAGAAVWLNVLYLAILCSAVAYYFYVVSLEVLGVTVCAVFLNLIPVITVIAGFLLLGERLNAAQLSGGAVVILGVYLATSVGLRKKAAAI